MFPDWSTRGTRLSLRFTSCWWRQLSYWTSDFISDLDWTSLSVSGRRNLCSGVVLILVSNIIYLLNNYTISWFSLHATEIALVRGVMQVIVFGIVILLGKRKQGKLDDTEGNNYIKMFPQNTVIHSKSKLRTNIQIEEVDSSKPLVERPWVD